MPFHFDRAHGVVLSIAAASGGIAVTLWLAEGRKVTDPVLISGVLSVILLAVGIIMAFWPNDEKSPPGSHDSDQIENSPNARLIHAERGSTAVGGDYNPTIVGVASPGVLSAAEELVAQYELASEALAAQDPPGRFHLAGEFSGWRDRIQVALEAYQREIQHLPLEEKQFHRHAANRIEECIKGALTCPHNERREDHLIVRAAEPMAELERWLEGCIRAGES